MGRGRDRAAPAATPRTACGWSRAATSSRRNSGRARRPICCRTDDKRVIFVNPYEGDLALIGTTDIPFDGRAEEVAITPERGRLSARGGQSLFRAAPLEAGDVIACVLRRPAAVRRQGGQSERGDARLCVRHRRAARRRADAVRVRRQDHDLSQARRARAGEAHAVFPADGRSLDERRRVAGRRLAGRGFCAVPGGNCVAGAPGCRRTFPSATRAGTERGPRNCSTARNRSAISDAISARPSTSARRDFLSPRNGRGSRRHPRAAHQTRPSFD